MTQVEMPQLSLRRYVDLVNRRRWQVVPVSLLGLLVGGMVAFFIPRLFVAETLLVHSQLPGRAADKDDPFRQIVASARGSIPLFVDEAVDELGWPEVKGMDAYDRDQYLRDVESRISVMERDGGDRTRSYVTLAVQYRDQDGPRSAALLNTLVDVWMKLRTEQLREPAKELRDAAKKKSGSTQATLQRLRGEKHALERKYGIDPSWAIAVRLQQYPMLNSERGEGQKQLATKKRELAVAEAQFLLEKEALAGLPRRRKPEPSALLVDALDHPEAKQLVASAVAYKMAFENTYVEGSAQWLEAKRAYENIYKLIEQMMPKREVDADGMEANPAYEIQRKKIDDSERVIAKLQVEVADKILNLKKEDERQEMLSEGYTLYENKLSQIEEATTEREEALQELKDANAILVGLTGELPVRSVKPAVVPPAPTEPDMLLVALLGCFLGLGAAIALILLFDLLQGSFKTLDDVERGLSVPVLGGVSYLETDEEREQTGRRRRRVSLVAVAALLMITAVVLVFYLDPTRLPPAVRDVLSMLLGA